MTPLIVMITAGSRGDVQPYIALGQGLLHAGYRVRLATHSIYEEWIRSTGIEFAPVEGDPQSMIETGEGQDWLESGTDGLKFMRQYRDLIGDTLHQAFKDTVDAVQDADLILASGLSYYAVHTASEKTGIPWMQTHLQPVHPTRDFESALFPAPIKLGGLSNYATHFIGGQIFWQFMRSIYNQTRQDHLGMPPYSFLGPVLEIEDAEIPGLYAFSSTLIPRPREWPAHVHITGYWFMNDTTWQPPVDLQQFLEGGPPPVYVGFGSMANRDPEATTRLVVEALERTGQRGILHSGWDGLRTQHLPDSIMALDYAPHDWLFSRMAAVVHHGGAGTTAAGVRAGVPSIVVPFFGDQPFWAERVYRAGLGPKPIPRKKLTADRLAAAVQQAVTDQPMIEAARRAGEAIRAEDGVGCAVTLIEQSMRY